MKEQQKWRHELWEKLGNVWNKCFGNKNIIFLRTSSFWCFRPFYFYRPHRAFALHSPCNCPSMSLIRENSHFDSLSGRMENCRKSKLMLSSSRSYVGPYSGSFTHPSGKPKGQWSTGTHKAYCIPRRRIKLILVSSLERNQENGYLVWLRLVNRQRLLPVILTSSSENSQGDQTKHSFVKPNNFIHSVFFWLLLDGR